jgi:putative Holliday junction resolvase
MRVLGIDVGLKRTGLAISDESGTAIRYLPNLKAKDRAQAMEAILSLVEEFCIQAIVIGLPEPKTTASKTIASRAHGLKEALDALFKAQDLNIKTYLWDETMTSQKALPHLVAAGYAQKKRKALLDAASAGLLIEEFLLWQDSSFKNRI